MSTELNLQSLRAQSFQDTDWSSESESATRMRFDYQGTSLWVNSDGSLEGDLKMAKKVKTFRAYRRFLEPRQPGVKMEHKLSLARQSRDARLDGQLLVCHYQGDLAVGKAYPKNKEEIDILYTALYDLHQCDDLLQDGDTIHLPNGKLFATVRGIHVELDAAFANRIR